MRFGCHKCDTMLFTVHTICKNYLNFFYAYAKIWQTLIVHKLMYLLIIQCRLSNRGGVCIIFQVVLSHRKEYVNMKSQDYVLRAWCMSLINFRTSISHRRCTYLELCPTKECWYMKQSTMSKNTFVV